jgi:formylglycine-generating enzyme required for sulfatase activity
MSNVNSKQRHSVAVVFAVASLIYSTSQRATAEISSPKPGSVFRDCANCPEMVVLPEGRFLMGSSPEESARDVAAAPDSDTSTAKRAVTREQPLHEATISSAFGLGRFPVTKREFAVFVEKSGYTPTPGCTLYALQYHVSPQADWQSPGFAQTERDPVVCVNWRDAKAYVEWLNKETRHSTSAEGDGPYRLPSEAEWEYAARAGTRTARWWGDSIGENNTVCQQCGSKWDWKQTAPVGSFHPNQFGVYDLLGNASQWTEDCWNEDYVNASRDGHPSETGNCERRVVRGGTWFNLPWVLRSSTRSALNQANRYDGIGFRIAKTLKLSSP